MENSREFTDKTQPALESQTENYAETTSPITSATDKKVGWLSLPNIVSRLQRNVKSASRQTTFQTIQRTRGNKFAQQVVKAVTQSAGTIQRDNSPNSPAPGQVKPDYNPSPEEARQALITALESSDLGRKAGEIFNKHKVGIVWHDTGTAGFEDRTNVCHINRKLGPREAASYFIHEMHHANEFHTGKTKSPEAYADSEKANYVKMMVNEEIEATFNQFESLYEMGGVGGNVSDSSPLKLLTPQYIRVRKDWISRHLKDNPSDQEGAEKLSKSKGKALIKYWFVRQTKGTNPSLAPNNFQSYEEYYAALFENAHKKGQPPVVQHLDKPTFEVSNSDDKKAESNSEVSLGHEESKGAAN